MLKINNYEFDIKFSETNFRQRNYNNQSYITINITSEFFPSLVKESIIYGAVDIKIDLTEIKSIDDLIGKEHKGDIGKLHISVCNDGIWEENTIKDFEITFEKRCGKDLFFEIKGKDFYYKDSSRMVSLYTTSTKPEELEKCFNLEAFYNQTTKREIGKSTITKYFIK